MAMQTVAPTTRELRSVVEERLSEQPVLIAESTIKVGLATSDYAPAISTLYHEAYQRGDYFAGRYEAPSEQIFNPDWLRQDFNDPDHLWFTFTDRDGALVGVTGFFHDYESESGPLMNSDETQIRPSGRGQRIMDRFFERVVPMIEQAGAGLAADFVLTPETKGLRRTLQTGLGMIALGIHPHILRHPRLPVTRSEISGAKYPRLTPKPAVILPAFEPLYRMVQQQVPALLEPVVIPAEPTSATHFGEHYREMEQPVPATDIDAQASALAAGFQPVAFNPDQNVYRMAQLPHQPPRLDFIHTNEQVAPNQALVRYMTEVLYKDSKSNLTTGGIHG